jgi:ADP-heptose:LPS heptosyltransferase
LILIVKYAGIGDIVMTLPSYYFLIEKHGTDNVFWCCDTSLVNFLEIFVPKQNIISRDFKKLHGRFHEKLLITLSINFLIIQKKWSEVFFFHADFRYKLMYFFGFKKVINYSIKFGTRQNFIHGRYSGINFFSMVSGIDGPELKSFDNYFLKAKSVISKLTQSNQNTDNNQAAPKKPYALICPSLSGNVGDQSAILRRLPTSKWQEIISAAFKKDYLVVAVGSKDEKEIIDSEFPNLINLCGKTSFEDLFHLISSAKCVIATDNGIMHCAYLTETKVIAIFGPTPPLERLPLISKVIPIYKSDLNCSPCFDGRLTHQCNNHDCLTKINLANLKDIL